MTEEEKKINTVAQKKRQISVRIPDLPISSNIENRDESRRDFLYYATGGVGSVTVGAALWPLINQMNPSADVKALSSIRVDISDVEPGTQLTVKWLGKPVFVRRRTQEEIRAARVTEFSELIDKSARNDNKPELDAADRNRTLDTNGEWLVMMGVCRFLAPICCKYQDTEDGL